jgi:hypothetical protein
MLHESEADLEAEVQVVAGRAVTAGPAMVLHLVAVGPAASVPETDLDLAVQA